MAPRPDEVRLGDLSAATRREVTNLHDRVDNGDKFAKGIVEILKDTRSSAAAQFAAVVGRVVDLETNGLPTGMMTELQNLQSAVASLQAAGVNPATIELQIKAQLETLTPRFLDIERQLADHETRLTGVTQMVSVHGPNIVGLRNDVDCLRTDMTAVQGLSAQALAAAQAAASVTTGSNIRDITLSGLVGSGIAGGVTFGWLELGQWLASHAQRGAVALVVGGIVGLVIVAFGRDRAARTVAATAAAAAGTTPAPATPTTVQPAIPAAQATPIAWPPPRAAQPTQQFYIPAVHATAGATAAAPNN